MGPGPIIAIVVVVSFLGMLGVVMVRSGAKPRAGRLVDHPESLSLTASLTEGGEEHRALFSLELGADASNVERLTVALERSGSLEALSRGVVHEVLQARSSGEGAPPIDADPQLSTALRAALAERGVALHRVEIGSVPMTPALRHLAEVWLSRCTRGGPTGRSQSINALEVYIDGACGRGDIYTASSRGAGTRRERTRSTELVEDPGRSVNYTVGKPTGRVRLNTLEELMRGAASS